MYTLYQFDWQVPDTGDNEDAHSWTSWQVHALNLEKATRAWEKHTGLNREWISRKYAIG